MRLASKPVAFLALAALLSPWAAQSQQGPEVGPAPAPETLTWEEALRRVDQQNPDLAQSQARVEEAEGVARQALAALLPVVIVTGSYTRNSDEAVIAFSKFIDTLETGLSQIARAPVTLDRSNVPADRVIQPLNALAASGTVRVPLFAANAYWDVLAAREAVQAATVSSEVARQRLRSAVLQALWLGSAAEAFVQVAERGVKNSEEYVQVAERGLRAGTTVPLAVLRAQTNLARRQKDLLEARSKLQEVRLSTGVLLGSAHPVRVEPPPLEKLEPGDEEALVAEALRERREMAAMASAERAASYGVDSAWWRLAPTVSATGSVFASDAPLITGEKQGWRAGLELTWTAYDGGFRYGKQRQARAVLSRTQAERKALELQIAREVRNALREARLNQEKLALSERERALAQEAARTAQNSFEKGVAGYTETLDALDRQYAAEAGEQEARSRLANALISLRTARGKLW